jgi:hypothetical protein
MRGSDEIVARDGLQHLTEVDHQCPGSGRNVDPFPRWVLRLQSADSVLHQKCQKAGVMVRVDAGFAVRRGRVVHELCERQRPLAEEIPQVMLIQPKTD